MFDGARPCLRTFRRVRDDADINRSSVPPDAVHNLERQVKDLGKQIEVKIYPGADHAFFNDTRPEVYKAEAAADAWQRTIALLRQHLSEKSA